MENDTDGVYKVEEEKTELQRELELFEAAEREEFLCAIRPERPREVEEEENRVAGGKRPLNGAGNRGRKKRGRKPQTQPPPPRQSQSRKKVEEDVCFVCYDGGELVLCDRRSCPKAYHPICVGRDEAFFRTKGSWTCGWHLCTVCEKPAKFMCYTCTYSVCKVCIKEAEFVCVRKNRGFCETCMQLVLMIEENKETNSDGAKIDFSDKETWEYLFKDYWMELKDKLSLTLEELQKANNPFKDTEDFVEEDSHSDETFDEDNESVTSSDSGSEQLVEEQYNMGTKRRRRSRTLVTEEEDDAGVEQEATKKEISFPRELNGWASKELMEFIGYINEDNEKSLSQCDVQGLLLTYIKQKQLEDPHNKSQIICDDRLQNLFGKSTVGHSELVKLLELHFTSKHLSPVQGNSKHENQEGPANDDDNPAELDDNNKERVGRIVTEKRRKPRKKAEDKLPKSNPNDYAAINVHNISLIYLRRALIEDLLEDFTSFNDKIVGSFVRIRISGIGNRQEVCYRLVQVVGTRKVGDTYNTGRKMTDIMLEISNLTKKEDISIDAVSNQDFTEEECKRLRQSIRCGLVNRPTVSELEEKAKALHEVKLNDWFETELLRLSHLRDRASEKGRRKELRECVEKLQLLSSPDERARKLQVTPEVIADPNVGLDYDSDDKDKAPDNSQDTFSNQWEKGLTKRCWDGNSPGRRVSGEHWDNAPRNSRKIWNSNKRNTSSWGNSGWEKGRCVGVALSGDKNFHGWSHDHGDNDDQNSKFTSWSWGNERDEAGQKFNDWEPQKSCSRVASGNHTTNGLGDKNTCRSNGWSEQERDQTKKSSLGAEFSTRANTCFLQDTSETEKIWHYQDPTGTIQGPFSMLQLRKWNTTGFFPLDLRIWKTHEQQEDSILLTDAIAGKFHKGSKNWEAKSHINQTPMGHKTGMRVGNTGTGWRGSSMPTWRGLERNDASRRSNWQVGSDLGSSANAEMKRNTDYQSFGWDNNANISQSKKSDNDGWSAPQNSESTWREPSTVGAPKSTNGGWGGGSNEGWGTPKSSVNAWPIPSTIEAPMSTDGGWSGGPSGGWGGSPTEGWNTSKGSDNALPVPSTVETPKSTKGGWDGGTGEGWCAPQCPESPWKTPPVVSVEIPKSSNEAWGGPQSSENTSSASLSVEVPKLTKEGWSGGPSEGWGLTQCPESPWKAPSTVTVEPPQSTNVGWGAPESSENMWSNPTTVEAPNSEKEGWVASQSSENIWSTPSTVETPKSTMGGWGGGPNEGWGAPQLSENLWTNPQAVEASKSTSEGWGAPQSSENSWATPSTVEAPQSTNEGWCAVQSSEHPWPTPSTVEAPKSTNEGWGAAPSDGWGGGLSGGGWDRPFSRTENVDVGKVGGVETWNSQTNYRSDSAGKFRSRPPNDGFRSSRNSKKDILCKFHGRGFCKKGNSCEFRHG